MTQTGTALCHISRSISRTLVFLCYCTAGLAQTPGSSTSASAGSSPSAGLGGLEEITVTATRRETSLEETPLSLSVISAADIVRDRVVSMTDVAQQIPSLTYIPDSGSETYLIIRGASTIDDSTGTDQGVSMFVDDVVRISVADLQPELFDMERVEVLKGPQGTLFGRNSIGGVVSLYTKNPTLQNEAGAELTYGRYNTFEAKGMLNLPVIDDKLAVRLVVTRHSNDGYIPEVVLNDYAGDDRSWAARAKILFTPNSDLRIVVGYDFINRSATQAKWMMANFTPELDPGLISDPRKSSQGATGFFDQHIWGLVGRIDWTNPLGELTSITGYRHLYVHDSSIVSGDPLVLENLQTTSRDSQFTEEVRLTSPSDQRLTWVTGLYYLLSNRSRPFDVPVVVLPNSFLSLITGVPPSVVPFHLDQDTRTTSYAAFADATYAFTDRLKLDVGGRYTREDKSGHSFVNYANIVTGPSISGNYSDSWGAFTPKVTLSYQSNPALLLYATVSKGFQSGGFNVQGSTDEALRVPFLPEYVWNYELGAKYDGLDHRLRANVTGFLDRYTNLQIVEYDAAHLTFTTTNAGKASVDGIETDVAVAPSQWITVGIRYDYLHTKFTDYVINNGPGVPPTDNTGNQVPFAAPNVFTANVDLHFDSPPLHGTIAFGADYTYRSPIQLTVANDTPADVRPNTEWNGVINLRASWTSTDTRWQVSLWGKNVTNRHFTNLAADQSIFFLSQAEANNPALHVYEGTLLMPAWFGLTFRIRT
jgi:iron complex outermembrane recepter protein